MLRRFAPADQSAARAVIESGLKEHFPEFDPGLNTDLDDICASYMSRGHAFLVAEHDGALVATGGLLVGEQEGQIVRVSVLASHRRRGVARAIVTALIAEARRRGLHAVWMETNDDWTSALALYLALGFRPFDHRDGCIYMRIDTDAQP